MQRTKKDRRAFFSRCCRHARESTLSSLWHLLQQAVALPSPTIGWLSMSFPAENDGLCPKRNAKDTEPVRSRVALAATYTKRTKDAKRSSRERALGAFKLRAKSESEPAKWDRDPYTKASIPTRDIETRHPNREQEAHQQTGRAEHCLLVFNRFALDGKRRNLSDEPRRTPTEVCFRGKDS